MEVKNKLTVGSCFSGIGGLELGLEWTGGFETKWQIEIDDYATRVLEKHWPNVKRYSDITKVRGEELEPVDLVCGGYPCQPFSVAGERNGEKDSRHLWPDMFRIIRIIRPRFALLENVAGHLSMGIGRVLGDLCEAGYDAEWKTISAKSIGAMHKRERVFIIAYSGGAGRKGFESVERASVCAETSQSINSHQIVGTWVDLEGNRMRLRNDNGISIGMERERLRIIGNAVVPQVAQKIGEMILAYEDKFHTE